MSYKAEHEAFVSGHTGTSHAIICTAVIASMLPLAVRGTLEILCPKSFLEKSFWLAIAVDIALLILPMEMIMSVSNEHSLLWLIIGVLAIILVTGMITRQDAVTKIRHTTHLLQAPMGNNRPFITNYRAFVNIFTAFSILAVDFVIFPRSFAKAETYGTGLMDVGVGCFLISNGIVSPEARGKFSAASSARQTILGTVKSSAPLLLLGLARVVATKSVDYQEHVTEYGTHWNFFFTLAAVKVLCTVLSLMVDKQLWNIAGVLIIAMYQHSLSYGGLKSYIVLGSDGKGGRQGLVDANREGLTSAVGFLCVYILGVQIGKNLMRPRSSVSDWLKVAVRLAVMSLFAWLLLAYSVQYVDPVSRRFANLSYLLWMMALNTLLLLVLLLLDILTTCLRHLHTAARNPESQPTTQSQAGQEASPKSESQQDTSADTSTDTSADTSTDTSAAPSVVETSQECLLMSAVNYNGLAFFLLANVTTGLVNMSMKTVYQPPAIAFAVISLYMIFLSVVISLLYHKQIRLKVW